MIDKLTIQCEGLGGGAGTGRQLAGRLDRAGLSQLTQDISGVLEDGAGFSEHLLVMQRSENREGELWFILDCDEVKPADEWWKELSFPERLTCLHV